MYEQRLKKMFKNQKEFSPKLGAPGLEQTKSRRPKTNRKHKKKKVSPKLQEMLENKEEVFSRKKGPGEAKEVNSKVAEFHSDDTQASRITWTSRWRSSRSYLSLTRAILGQGQSET